MPALLSSLPSRPRIARALFVHRQGGRRGHAEDWVHSCTAAGRSVRRLRCIEQRPIPSTAEIAWHQQEAEKELQIDVGSPSGPEVSASDLLKDVSNPPPATFGESPKSDATGDLGIPSVIKAELTPTEDSASRINLPLSPLRPTTGNVDPSPLTNQPPQPPATKAGEVVAPPSLLSNNSKMISNPTIEAKPRSLAELQPLREPPPVETTPVSTESQPSLIPEDPAAARHTPSDLTGKTPEVATPPTPQATPLNTNPLSSTLPADTTAVTPPLIKPISTVAAFEAAMREAHTNIDEEKWYQALFLLSKFYNSPDLSSEQQKNLLDLLDPLAAKVVYSQEHLVSDGHVVQRGETLHQIANANQVPVDLIANINGLDKTGILVPGTNLKIVQGPFRADVDLKRQELTLFAGQLYAAGSRSVLERTRATTWRVSSFGETAWQRLLRREWANPEARRSGQSIRSCLDRAESGVRHSQ